MRVALLTTQVPFVFGGAELLAGNLRDQLRLAGHEAEIVSIPFNWYPTDRLRDSIVAAGLLDLSEFNNMPIDLAIGLKFPAYLAKHPRKAFWLLHQHRQAYDMWDAGKSDLISQADGALWKGAIDQADRTTLVKGPVFTISANVTKRLAHYNGIESIPLYHPPPLAPLLHSAEPDEYVLVPSRISPDKRQSLVLEALARTKSGVRAVFVGRPDDRAYGNQLLQRAEALGLRSRLNWLEDVSPDRLAELYARCLAVVFMPENEDYGYVTLEAMLASKPVVTAIDSGGPLEFVSNEHGAFVTAPDAGALATTLDLIWSQRSLAADVGQKGRQRYFDMEIGWDHVIGQLTGEPIRPSGPPQGRPADLGAARSLVSAVAPEILVDTTAIEKLLPVKNAAELLQSFDFEELDDQEAEAYFQTHWRRYLATIAMLPRGEALRILDIGGASPLLALIKILRPGSTFTIVVEDQPLKDDVQRFRSKSSAEDLVVKLSSFNAERDRFPFPDGAFDVVLALEIVEHLALNPFHLFSEAHRVLAPNGSILVTTPNIVSARSLSLAHAGDPPYSFGIFLPHHGVYGRHNREYTPHEIELLGRSAGFGTEMLRTYNVYGDESEYFNLPLLSGSTYPFRLRGRNIFYRGRRGGSPMQDAWRSLYYTDPMAVQGKLAVREDRSEPANIGLVLHNTGPRPWLARGPSRVHLRIEILTAEGRRDGECVELALDADVPSGAEHVMVLPIGRGQGGAVAIMRVQLLQNGFGSLENLGIRPVECLVSPAARAYFANLPR